jgi:hypothetical protein
LALHQYGSEGHKNGNNDDNHNNLHAVPIPDLTLLQPF